MDAVAANSVNPPLVRMSTTVFESFDAYKQAQGVTGRAGWCSAVRPTSAAGAP